jgi:HAD superfamily hydrolase (TIGR01458 family)
MVRGVLIDLSGTLHVGGKVMPCAVESLKRLRAAGKRVRFLTNTSTKSTSRLWQELLDMGLCESPQDEMEEMLLTSVLATKQYLMKHRKRPLCLMEDVSDFEGSINLSPPHDSVVVGLAPTKLNYENLNQAFRILLNNSKSSAAAPNKLIAIHRGNFLRDADGELSLGPGGFVTALETATSSSSDDTVIMGKPSTEFYQSAMWPDLKPDEICMIGDDVLGDIQGAQKSGIGTTILVRTGKYRTGDESKIETPPTRVCDSIAQAIDFILESEKTNAGKDDPKL